MHRYIYAYAGWATWVYEAPQLALHIHVSRTKTLSRTRSLLYGVRWMLVSLGFTQINLWEHTDWPPPWLISTSSLPLRSEPRAKRRSRVPVPLAAEIYLSSGCTQPYLINWVEGFSSRPSEGTLSRRSRGTPIGDFLVNSQVNHKKKVLIRAFVDVGNECHYVPRSRRPPPSILTLWCSNVPCGLHVLCWFTSSC